MVSPMDPRSTVARFVAAAIVAVVCAAGTALAAGPPVVAVPSRRFDHDRHAAAARAAGKPAECASCHDDKKPRSEHTRCVSCHVFPSSCTVMRTPGSGGPARVCRTCHVATRPECLPGDLPPLPAATTFTARFSHARHIGLGSSIDRDCGICHKSQVPAPPTQKAHVLCSGCHNPNGARPQMAECASCHVARAGRAAPGAPAAGAATDPFRIKNFDHQAHMRRTGLTACSQCHDKAVGDAPKATMLGCQNRCHDGEKAFAATGTHCTQCHKAAAPAQPARADLPFRHAEHARHSVKIDDCASCHGVDNDGTLTAPLSRKDHLPCASSGCHQNEFISREPRICGICHDSAAPWQRAAARRPPRSRPAAVEPAAASGPAAAPETDEWHEVMNHASHLALGAGAATTCEGCHGDKRTGAEPPRDHRACATCHARGPRPAMTDCKACHSNVQQAARQVSPWNVAATFDHKQHAVDPRSRRPAACSTCHTQVSAARTMAQVAPPRMADCDGCHDGKITFKTTGFGCARCHGPRIAGGGAPGPGARP